MFFIFAGTMNVLYNHSRLRFFRGYLYLCIVFLFLSCIKDRERSGTGRNRAEQNKTQQSKGESSKIARAKSVVFLLENSASIFGYVSRESEYKETIIELSENPELIKDGVAKEFFLINGGEKLNFIPIGSTREALENNLNEKGFKRGEYTKSNINGMFQFALQKANKDTIVVLVSDGIYDMEKGKEQLGELKRLSKITRSVFLERLQKDPFQTLIIKLVSEFDGFYYPVKGGAVRLNQKRPYYIWIFGDDHVLNKYFPEDYLKKLAGFENFTRLRILGNDSVPYETIRYDKNIGRFRTHRENRNQLSEVEKRNGTFQFSFAVDYSGLPYNREFLSDKNNYEVSNSNYEMVSIEPANENRIKDKLPFAPTDIITVRTTKDPYGDLEVKLKYHVPRWIEETHTDDDADIKGDSEHTVGIKYLLGGITEAYEEQNKEKSIAKFDFKIMK